MEPLHQVVEPGSRAVVDVAADVLQDFRNLAFRQRLFEIVVEQEGGGIGRRDSQVDFRKPAQRVAVIVKLLRQAADVLEALNRIADAMRVVCTSISSSAGVFRHSSSNAATLSSVWVPADRFSGRASDERIDVGQFANTS